MTPGDDPIVIDWTAELVRHRDWLHGIARSRLRDDHAADDVIQDVSLAVIRQNGRPTDPGKIRAWLYQVVIRRVADYFRKHYRQSQFGQEIVDASAVELTPDDNAWITRTDSPQLLRNALQQLSEDDRRMFVLKYVENWSYRQLAERFQISERAIEYRLVRAKQQLRSIVRSLETGEAEA